MKNFLSSLLLIVPVLMIGITNVSAESFGSDCKFIMTQPNEFVYHLELINKNTNQRDALCRVVTHRVENYKNSTAKITSMTESSLDISVSDGDKFTIYVEKDGEAINQYFEHPIVTTKPDTDTGNIDTNSTDSFGSCILGQESLENEIYQFAPWDSITKKCNDLCSVVTARIENYENSTAKITNKNSCKVEITANPGDKFTLYLEKNGETISKYTEVPSEDKPQCQNYVISGGGKFSVELLDHNGQRNANCRFVQYDYEVLSGNTKLIGMNEYALIFDATQNSKIKITTTSPSYYWAEFNITASSKSDTNVIQTLSSSNITEKRLPPAGYEDEVLIVINTFVNPFPDTSTNNVEGKAATELYRRAIIGGFPDGEFKGTRPVNRAEAAKILLLARGIEVQELTNNGKFWDIKEGEWYVKYVMTAAQKGIISGHPDGSFKPADTVNTAEFLKMLTLTFNLQKNLSYSYTDVQTDDWFAQYAGTATKYNLLPNRSSRNIEPNKQLTRNEVAVAIYQYFSNR